MPKPRAKAKITQSIWDVSDNVELDEIQEVKFNPFNIHFDAFKVRRSSLLYEYTFLAVVYAELTRFAAAGGARSKRLHRARR